jgi:hypothetical protein
MPLLELLLNARDQLVSLKIDSILSVVSAPLECGNFLLQSTGSLKFESHAIRQFFPKIGVAIGTEF